MGDVTGRRRDDDGMRCRRSRGGRGRSPTPVLLLYAALTLATGLLPGSAHAQNLPAKEFVVPGGPSMTLQDGQRIDGHIVKLDQTNVVIRTADGTEQSLPRALIDIVRFETVTGSEIAGALIDWKSGVYELTTEEATVTVYSTVILPPPSGEPVREAVAALTAESQASPSGTEAAAPAPDAVAIPETARTRSTDRGDDRDAKEETVAVETPGADLEISVSVQNARENGDPVAFDIELSRPSESSVVLIYSTINGTAVDGEDYEAMRGVLVIEAGQTSARIEAAVIDDDVSEADEDLQLFLTVDPNVAVVKNRQIIATIEDDDRG